MKFDRDINNLLHQKKNQAVLAVSGFFLLTNLAGCFQPAGQGLEQTNTPDKAGTVTPDPTNSPTPSETPIQPTALPLPQAPVEPKTPTAYPPILAEAVTPNSLQNALATLNQEATDLVGTATAQGETESAANSTALFMQVENTTTAMSSTDTPTMTQTATATATEAPAIVPIASQEVMFPDDPSSAVWIGKNRVDHSVWPGGITDPENWNQPMNDEEVKRSIDVFNGFTDETTNAANLDKLRTARNYVIHNFLGDRNIFVRSIGSRIEGDTTFPTSDGRFFTNIDQNSGYEELEVLDENGNVIGQGELYKMKAPDEYRYNMIGTGDHQTYRTTINNAGELIAGEPVFLFDLSLNDGTAIVDTERGACGNTGHEYSQGPIVIPTTGPTPTPSETPIFTSTPHQITPTSTLIITTEVPPTRVNTQIPPTVTLVIPPTDTDTPPTRIYTQPPVTEIPPTAVPPTSVPPTEVPPTAVPPTDVPPPPPTDVPTTGLQTTTPSPEAFNMIYSQMITPILVVSLIMAIIGWGYMVYFTASRGQTLGKMAMKIKVININTGKSPDYLHAFLREVPGKFISSILLELGYLWMLWDKNKQTWHDKMAGTVVVNA